MDFPVICQKIMRLKEKNKINASRVRNKKPLILCKNVFSVFIYSVVDISEHLKPAILRQRNFTTLWKATH